MDHAITAGGEFNECAKVRRADDLALELLADGDVLCQALNHADGAGSHFSVRRADIHGAVVFDIDGRAGLFDDAANGLATGADERADALRVDLDACHARGERAEFLAGGGDGLAHVR